MKTKRHQSFLGRGWSFPPAFDREIKSIEMVEEADDIRQSLFILLSTTPGERTMRPLYGCDLQSIVFERMNEHTKNRIVDMVSKAVLDHEPRVTLNVVSVEFMDQGVLIDITYTIREINVRTNIVYPFYLVEGTDVVEV